MSESVSEALAGDTGREFAEPNDIDTRLHQMARDAKRYVIWWASYVDLLHETGIHPRVPEVLGEQLSALVGVAMAVDEFETFSLVNG